MIIFKKLRNKTNKFDTTDITFESEAESLPEILDDMRDFLAACGYAVSYKDTLVIEKEEEEINEE
jgi:hypothetical protein